MALCCRRMAGSLVAVVHHPAQGAASFAGLQTCGSVWHCPVCATKISERRREELAAAVGAWEDRGGRVLMVTYTIRHKRSDDLAASVDGLLKARRYARSGGAAVRITERFGIAGSIRALEVTHGENGWHPHLHELLFVAGDADPGELLAELRERWAAMVGLAGLRDVNEHGVQVEVAQMSVAEYLAKFGRARSWGPEHELSKANVKQGRKAGKTPMGLLADYGAGGERSGALWREYAQVFKGRRQLAWSRGLRELLGLEAEKTDAELAAQQEERGSVLVLLDKRQWGYVLGNDARGELLEAARPGHVDAVWEFLWGLGCPIGAT